MLLVAQRLLGELRCWPNGGQAVHGRAVATDSAGDVKTCVHSVFGTNGTKGVRGASNTVERGWRRHSQERRLRPSPNGARAGRAGETTLNPDGSATHQSGFRASGANGSIQSTGSSQRGANGSAPASDDDGTGKNGNTTTGRQNGKGTGRTTRWHVHRSKWECDSLQEISEYRESGRSKAAAFQLHFHCLLSKVY